MAKGHREPIIEICIHAHREYLSRNLQHTKFICTPVEIALGNYGYLHSTNIEKREKCILSENCILCIRWKGVQIFKNVCTYTNFHARIIIPIEQGCGSE